MSKINYDFFKSHLEELLVQYYGKYIVIKDESVIGSFEDFDTAYDTTSKSEKLGTFIIQRCVSEEENMVRFISNNVLFV